MSSRKGYGKFPSPPLFGFACPHLPSPLFPTPFSLSLPLPYFWHASLPCPFLPPLFHLIGWHFSPGLFAAPFPLPSLPACFALLHSSLFLSFLPRPHCLLILLEAKQSLRGRLLSLPSLPLTVPALVARSHRHRHRCHRQQDSWRKLRCVRVPPMLDTSTTNFCSLSGWERVSVTWFGFALAFSSDVMSPQRKSVVLSGKAAMAMLCLPV